ncbi:MAG: enolase C-terminal domain-like protein [Candidatus Brocadiia bacterium]
MGMTRRQALARAAGGALGALAGRVPAGTTAPDTKGYLRSLEAITCEYEHHGRPRRRSILRATTTDGVVGGARVLGGASVAEAEEALRGQNLFDAQAVWKRLAERQVGNGFLRAAVDIVCWDLHARTRKMPLHALLGTKRTRYRPYGDERWRDTMTPESYARGVARNFARRGNLCTKLHIPGTYKVDRAYARNIGEKGWDLDTLLHTLRAVRAAVGDEVALAYDPHPQKAAALALDDARRIARVLDQCRYEWVECLLPPEPERLDDWLQLRKLASLRFQREESPAQTADQEIRWLRAGAANQVTWDCRFGGITELLRILGWIREHPEARAKLNLHYSAPAHEHIAAATTDEEFPWVEACFDEDRYKDGTTAAPDWVGVAHIDWDFIEKHRI